MIPIYLKVSGIYSYREPQEVDFRTLVSSHLFGIFGAVGSGKSALLEAIMFVLYGETERLNSRELRSYNMMNLKSNESFIQFDFLASGNKGEFRAIAKGKRNSRNKEDVKFERTLYRIEGKTLLPVETSEIQNIIGISYENFRRTIIIPQGKFQEFLLLPPTQRTDMVKELFNLQKYDLSFKTGLLQKKNDNALSNCQGRLEQLGAVSAEDISRQQEELGILVQELSKAADSLRGKEILEQDLQMIVELRSSLLKNQELLKELETRKPEIQLAEQRLNDYDKCVSNFKSDIDLLDDKRRQASKQEALLSLKKEEQTHADIAYRSAESRFLEARKIFETRENLALKAKELKLCARINTRTKEAGLLAERILKGEKQVSDSELDLESMRAQVKQFNALQDTLKTQLPDISKLQQASAWFSTDTLLKAKRNDAFQNAESCRSELSSIEKEIIDIYGSSGLIFQGSMDSFQSLPGELNVRKSEFEEIQQLINTKLLHLEIQLKLQSFAAELHDGEPCPLCGSPDHPDILEAGTAEAEMNLMREKKEALAASISKLESGINKFKILFDNYLRKKALQESLNIILKQAESAFQDHLKGFLWQGMTEEKLAGEYSSYSRLQKEIEKLDALDKEALGKAEIEAGKVTQYLALLGQLRIDHEKARQDAASLLTQITLLDQAAYASTTEEALMEQSGELREKYRVAGEQHQAAEKVYHESQSALKTLNGAVATTEYSLVSLKNSIVDLSKQLEARILSSRFKTEFNVRETLALEIDRPLEQQGIRAFHESLASATSVLLQLEAQLKGKHYDGLAHEQLKQEISSLKVLIDQKKELKGAKEEVIARLSKDLEEIIRLRTELKSLETRQENLKTLAALFKAQGFVNFVSTMHLQNLISAANDRFYRLTRQQLKLELDSENNFRIRDYLNEGQWRNVKTLSGGQTFQASLCLALALADNIQQLNQSGQNFFFLDEGFGTLDRESLEQVFETLKSLRKENRIVGIISHVEDLQQEIGAWLRITRDEEYGSIVTTSWS